MQETDRDLLVQTRQRVDKLLVQLRAERAQLLQSTKLDSAAINAGVVAMDAMIAALEGSIAALLKRD